MTTDTVPHENVVVEELPADEYTTSTLTVDFLYLDREVCERCQGTEQALHTALEQVTDVLSTLDIEVTLRKIHVDTRVAVRQTALEISPTIRIDGRDIQPDYIESECESNCIGGEGSGGEQAVDCREWLYRGRTYSTPPVALLVEKFLRVALSKSSGVIDGDASDQYRVPTNLQRYFGDAADQVSTSGDGDEPTEDSCSC